MTSISHQLSGFEIGLVRQHPTVFVAWQTLRYAGIFSFGLLLAAVAAPEWLVGARAIGVGLLVAVGFGLIAGCVLLAVARRGLRAES